MIRTVVKNYLNEASLSWGMHRIVVIIGKRAVYSLPARIGAELSPLLQL